MKDRLLNVLDLTNEKIGKAVSYLILAMVMVIVFETIVRYIFNAPTVWVHDVSGWLQVVYVMLGGGLALKRGYWVRVDIFYDRFSPRTKAFLDLTFSTVLFILFVSILLWKGVAMAYKSVAMGEVSAGGMWSGPVYPAKITVPIGALLLCVFWLSKIIRDLRTFRQKEGKS